MSRHDDILRASAKAIAARGVRGLRVSDVAKVAGVATGLIYYHFNDREGLLSATLEFLNERTREFRRLPGQETSTPTVHRLIEQFTAEFLDSEEVIENARVWNEFRASAVYEPALLAPMLKASTEWTADIAESIKAAQDAGNVPPEIDANMVAAQIAVVMEGLDSRWLTGEFDTRTVHFLLQSFAKTLLGAH